MLTVGRLHGTLSFAITYDYPQRLLKRGQVEQDVYAVEPNVYEPDVSRRAGTTPRASSTNTSSSPSLAPPLAWSRPPLDVCVCLSRFDRLFSR